jgi:DNA-binding FadR family transcriptional regulator
MTMVAIAILLFELDAQCLRAVYRKRKGLQAKGVLLEYWLSGNIEPNSYLPSEAELCGKLGVGRTTLREAVKALESGGFVTRRHGKGRQVVDESHRATSDILQLLLKRKKASLRELLEARRIVET